MSKIYLVIKSSYEDFTILGAYEDKERAEWITKALKDFSILELEKNCLTEDGEFYLGSYIIGLKEKLGSKNEI